MKIIVEEAVTGRILTRDLVPLKTPEVVRTLSGPSSIKLSVSPHEAEQYGIHFKAYGQIVHAEVVLQNGHRWIFASAIVQSADVSAETGEITISATGFSNYPDKIPWLDNWNPIAVDPFEVIHRVWSHVQSYPQGNLGVEVYPANSNTLLLPGFYYDGSKFNLDFFAYFVRAEDYRDCLQEITSLCRDVPIDYFEESTWGPRQRTIAKKIRLAYPRGGARQENLMFRERENVLSMAPAGEMEMDYVSDVIVRGWFPGKMYSSTLSNADPLRFRRVVREEDALLNSRERSEVWCRRQLAKRQVPYHWASISVDMDHPNAPFGTYDVGDDILISGRLPSVGRRSEWHRILTMQVDDVSGTVSMTTKHVDAFNYDPITFPER
jgi:hypothetical protein